MADDKHKLNYRRPELDWETAAKRSSRRRTLFLALTPFTCIGAVLFSGATLWGTVRFLADDSKAAPFEVFVYCTIVGFYGAVAIGLFWLTARLGKAAARQR
jgi:hypothetical protein